MKVLVTGSNGFIAKNFIQFLSEKPEVEILKAHRETTDQEFEQVVLAADWIVHLAGVNRPLNEEEFAEGNTTLTEKISQILQQANKKTPVILSSSIQVQLGKIVQLVAHSEYSRMFQLHRRHTQDESQHFHHEFVGASHLQRYGRRLQQQSYN